MEKLSLNTRFTHLKPLLREMKSMGVNLNRSEAKGLEKLKPIWGSKALGEFATDGLSGVPTRSKSLDIYIPKTKNKNIRKVQNILSGKRGTDEVTSVLSHELGHTKAYKELSKNPSTKKYVKETGNIFNIGSSSAKTPMEREAWDLAGKLIKDTKTPVSSKIFNRTANKGLGSYKMVDTIVSESSKPGTSRIKTLKKVLEAKKSKESFL